LKKGEIIYKSTEGGCHGEEGGGEGSSKGSGGEEGGEEAGEGRCEEKVTRSVVVRPCPGREGQVRGRNLGLQVFQA